MDIKIVKNSISRDELLAIAKEGFGDLVKAVIDIKQEIMAVGGELHSDEELALVEQCGSHHENTWGVNLYPTKSGEDFIEFDSMINLKPMQGNRSRAVENPAIRDKIVKIVNTLISNIA